MGSTESHGCVPFSVVLPVTCCSAVTTWRLGDPGLLHGAVAVWPSAVGGQAGQQELREGPEDQVTVSATAAASIATTSTTT